MVKENILLVRFSIHSFVDGAPNSGDTKINKTCFVFWRSSKSSRELDM